MEFDRFRANSTKMLFETLYRPLESQNLPDFGQMSGLVRSVFARNRADVRLITEVSRQNNFMPGTEPRICQMLSLKTELPLG